MRGWSVPKLFQAEIVLNATAYIKAETAEEARTKLTAWIEEWDVELEGDGISDLMFQDPDLPEVSVSPAMTPEYDGSLPDLSDHSLEEDDDA